MTRQGHRNFIGAGIAGALLAAGAGSPALAREKPDALASLATSTADGAGTRAAALYRKTRDPYARLWIVDMLYERVERHQDAEAMEALLAAAGDDNADVRRRALAGLEAFKRLPEDAVVDRWLSRVRDAARRAEKDTDVGVRAAGARLKAAADRWTPGPAQAPRAGGLPTPEDGARAASSRRRAAFWGVLAAMVAFQMTGYAWLSMGVALLRQAGDAGRATIDAWEACHAHPRFHAFPATASLLLLVLLGGSLSNALTGAAMPAGGEGGLTWAWAARAYLLGGMGVLLPSLALAGYAWRAQSRRSAALWRRLPGLAALAFFVLAALWPWELLSRAVGRRPKAPRRCAWAAQIGSPFAACVAAVIMVRDGVGWWRALGRASESFGALRESACDALWARPLAQPQFVLLCLAAPALFAASLFPAIAWAGLRPAQMFGLWLVSDAQFAVGFGLWSGAILSAAWLAQIEALGAVRAAALVVATDASG